VGQRMGVRNQFDRHVPVKVDMIEFDQILNEAR
jgi:hypothetical protein